MKININKNQGMTNGIYKNIRGQVTLFIILAIFIIGVIALFFLISPSMDISSKNLDNPREYIEQCADDATQDALDNIFSNYGYSTLDTNYYLYSGENVPYLCKASEFYIPCTPQDPMFVGRIKNERSEERRVGKECKHWCRSRWSPYQ